MKIPKIEFKTMSLQENIEIVKWAYYDDGDVLNIRNFTIQYFPELAKIDKSLSKKEVYKIIENIVTKNYYKSMSKIKEEVKLYNLLWEPFNNKYFEMLSNYLEIEWPKNIDKIIGKIGLIPVFPRYLDDFSFSVTIGIEDEKLIETCAHESLHFLWFLKWKTIYPETPREHYESPYITWQYSEMVTDPILNNKPFKDIFKFKEKGYDSFYKMYDEESLVMDNLRNIYSENISINEKIDKGFRYIKNVLEKNKKDK